MTKPDALTESLRRYMKIRAEAIAAEDEPCTCREFERCGRCDHEAEANHNLRNLLQYWGDTWAVALARRLAVDTLERVKETTT
jgi:hypothetical protein